MYFWYHSILVHNKVEIEWQSKVIGQEFQQWYCYQKLMKNLLIKWVRQQRILFFQYMRNISFWDIHILRIVTWLDINQIVLNSAKEWKLNLYWGEYKRRIPSINKIDPMAICANFITIYVSIYFINIWIRVRILNYKDW